MKVQIEVGAIHSRISGSYPRYQIDKALSAYREGYFFSKAFKKKRWDGKKHFLTMTGRFPTGLLPRVKYILKKSKTAYEVVGRSNGLRGVVPVESLPDGTVMRDYQIDAQVAFLRRGRGVWEHATGSGKTESAIALCKALNVQTMVLVRGLDLMTQTRKRFRRRLKEPIGVLGGGKRPQGHERVVIASVDTLSASLRRKLIQPVLKQTQLLIFDETHHAAATTWQKIATICPARYRLGMSGTAFTGRKERDMSLEAVTGPRIHRVTSTELIKRGILAKPTLTFVKIDEDKPNWDMSSWAQAYQDLIVKNKTRNTAIAMQCKSWYKEGHRRILVLVRSIKHGELLKRAIILPTVYLHGSHDLAHRQRFLKKFRRGEFPVLIASTIFDEGIDIPEIDALVLASGGKSRIKTIQRLGRGLRKKATIDGTGGQLPVLEFVDYGNQYLLRHSLSRLYDYRTEKGFKVKSIRAEDIIG